MAIPQPPHQRPFVNPPFREVNLVVERLFPTHTVTGDSHVGVGLDHQQEGMGYEQSVLVWPSGVVDYFDPTQLGPTRGQPVVQVFFRWAGVYDFWWWAVHLPVRLLWVERPGFPRPSSDVARLGGSVSAFELVQERFSGDREVFVALGGELSAFEFVEQVFTTGGGDSVELGGHVSAVALVRTAFGGDATVLVNGGVTEFELVEEV